jgi:RNA-directed DNA polymerase
VGYASATLDQRVTDGVIRRMIDKWLKAGVLEDGFNAASIGRKV